MPEGPCRLLSPSGHRTCRQLTVQNLRTGNYEHKTVVCSLPNGKVQNKNALGEFSEPGTFLEERWGLQEVPTERHAVYW